EEVSAFLRRARDERSPAALGSRNGVRPRPVQTAEGELTVAMPRVRAAAVRFVTRVIPDTRTALRTRPLAALVIGADVRGLSDRDGESRLAEAGLGHVSESAVSGLCRERRAGDAAFQARGLADAERRLRALVGELARPDPSAAACLADDLPALCVHPRYAPR